MQAQVTIHVRVQHEDFDTAQLQASLLGGSFTEGAIATFTGYVRSDNERRTVQTLELEHYPGMTERSISEIVQQAASRWPLLRASVVHRVGVLGVGEQIVWVGVSSRHREAAFSACEFIMDFLKTRAPFWKKEHGPDGESWVDARQHDNDRADRWGRDSAE
ncbi:MAG: molybdopterin synthase catalytic subunit MoaE [Halioglobus sp.]